MLVICEDCAKKYNIDESRIKGNRARFTCNACGHIIIVDKSDFSRTLFSSAADHASSSSSLDLLKEMQSPLPSDPKSVFESTDQPDGLSDTDSDKAIARKGKGMTITAYFLIGGALSFFITSAGIAYILGKHYSTVSSQHMEQYSGMLLTSVLILLSSWLLSFVILFGMGTYLSRIANKMTASLNRINQGEKELEIIAKGPRELTALAEAISSLCRKIK